MNLVTAVLALVLVSGFATANAASVVRCAELDQEEIKNNLNNTAIGRMAAEKLDKEFGPLDRELMNIKNEEMAILDQLKSDSANEALNAKRIELENTFNKKRQEFIEKLSIRRQAEFQKMTNTVMDVIFEVMQEKGFDAIFTKDGGLIYPAGEDVLCGTGKTSLTKEILNRIFWEGFNVSN